MPQSHPFRSVVRAASVGTGAQTANQHNIIAGVEFALAEAEVMLDGVRPVECLTDPNIAGDLPFGFLKYERLYREQIDDALDLVRQADAYRIESNTIRPRKALAWNRPSEVHQGLADSINLNFPEPEIPPTT